MILELQDAIAAMIERKKAGGLKHIRLFLNPNVSITAKEFIEEFNRMEAAPDISDVEVLGRYSPKSQ